VIGQLVALHNEKFICLSAWDESDRPLDEWRDTDYFFAYDSDGQYKRIRLLLKGAELLEKLAVSEPAPKRAIGFTANS
jgi:hypothetical protein